MDNEKINQDIEETPETEEVQEVQAEPSEVEVLTGKVSELEDKYMRLRAEYDNYQKRTQKEKDSRYSDAVIATTAELLPVMDNLQRAIELETSTDEAAKIKEGVMLVIKQFTDSLTKLGISAINAVGEEFDPEIHNAIQHIEDETVTDNTIVEEYVKGYIYKDNRVVRHSVVKVAN